MKAVNTGRPGTPITNIRGYLYCCNRSVNELDFYIPAATLADVQVYVDLGTKKPIAYQTILYSLCDDTYSAIAPDQYIIGKTPEGTWYAVFTFPNNIQPPRYFSIVIYFAFAGTDDLDLYFSEGYEHVILCRPLTKIEACFPIRRTDEFGYDCNGIYFGTTTDMAASLGDVTLAYNHFAYTRRSKVKKEAPKLTFTSNVRRNFRTKVERLFELRTELVPNWYKEYLLAIYSRGFIKVENVVYQVTDLNFSGVGDNDLTWKPYCKLTQIMEYQFGCEDCLPAVLPCVNNINADDYYLLDGVFNQLFQGSLGAGNQLEWQLYSRDGSLLSAGLILTAPLRFTDNTGIDPYDACYILKWRVKCSSGLNSDWKQKQFGDCTPAVTPILGNIDMFPTGSSSQGGAIKMVIDFPTPTPGPIVYKAGFDRTNTAGSFASTSEGYPLPRTYPVGSAFNGFNADNGVIVQFDTIPAGTTHYEKMSVLAEPGVPYGYISKGVFHSLTLPAGFSLQLNPVRSNLVIELR